MIFRNQFFFRLYFILIAGASVSLFQAPAFAADPKKKHSENIHGDFVLIGNTGAQDCATGVPAPVPGSTIGSCGMNTDDTGVDVFWQADPKSGTAAANVSISSDKASTVSVLKLPAGATVTYARLIWSAGKDKADMSPNQVTLVDPAGVSHLLLGDNYSPLNSYASGSPELFYQNGADVTEFVNKSGAGAYQVSKIPSFDIRNAGSEVAYVAWSMVIFYRLDSEPLRNLAYFEGLNQVDSTKPVNATIDGFQVPSAGYDAKLGVIAYEGDNRIPGDALSFKGMVLSDAQNPANNFFNSTRDLLGTAVSVPGDLPQMLGSAGSMSGVDLDVINVTSILKPGDTKAAIQATSTCNKKDKDGNCTQEDVYLIGGFVTSISTLLPDLSPTVKDFTNETSHDKTKNHRGDIIEYTIDVKNTGTDTAIDTIVTDTLPPQVTYQGGSLVLCTNGRTNCKALTDKTKDDAGEVVAGTIIVRLGDVPLTKAGDPVPFAIKVKVAVNADAIGTISNQAVIKAQGKEAATHGIPAGTYQSGAPGHPGMPTTFDVFICATDTDCKGPNEHCDTTHIPTPICTNDCTTDNDCKGGEVCDKGQCEPTTDLMITATDALASNHAMVTYAIDVQNLGPTPAGATVSYVAPAGVSIQSVDGKGVFTCTPNGNQVQCVSKNAMQVGENDEIDLVVAQVDLSTVSFRAEVAANGIAEPNQTNNVVELNTLIPVEPTNTPPADKTYELSGGGFWGCSASSQAGQTGGLGLSLWVVSILALGAYQVSRRARKFA